MQTRGDVSGESSASAKSAELLREARWRVSGDGVRKRSCSAARVKTLCSEMTA